MFSSCQPRTVGVAVVVGLEEVKDTVVVAVEGGAENKILMVECQYQSRKSIT